jgi:hypothetical protein
MDINFAEMGLSAVRVLIVGLILGAGLPALFALGMRLQAAGLGEEVVTTGSLAGEHGRRSPGLVLAGRILFAAVILVVLLAVLWITRHSLNHYFGLTIFGAGAGA